MTRTSLYPYTSVAGWELRAAVNKDAWISLVVDLIRASIGEGMPSEEIRREIATRLDILHRAGVVPGKLPSRFERASEWSSNDEPTGGAVVVWDVERPVHAVCGGVHSIGTECPSDE